MFIRGTIISSVGLPICLRERSKAVTRSLCNLLEDLEVGDVGNISSSGSSVKCRFREDMEGKSVRCLVDLEFGIGLLRLVAVPMMGVDVAKCSEPEGLLGVAGCRNGGLNVGLEELLAPLIVEEAVWFLPDV